jgi:hypothetical protein
MEVGDVVTVYNEVDRRDEVCDLGQKHRVPIYMVKRLTITSIQSELVKFLHYTEDGYGDVLYAVDAQGRGYRKEPHWDGPRASLWVRAKTPYGQQVTFDQYPLHTFSRDLAGRPLHL